MLRMCQRQLKKVSHQAQQLRAVIVITANECSIYFNTFHHRDLSACVSVFYERPDLSRLLLPGVVVTVGLMGKGRYNSTHLSVSKFYFNARGMRVVSELDKF